MKNNKCNLKAIVLSLGLAAMLLPATNLNAQDRPGGLFSNNSNVEPTGSGMMIGGGIMRRGPISTNGGSITNQGIGEPEVPLGSGLFILLGAGLGYVALKKKED